MNQLDDLLGRVRAGDLAARDALFASCYGELRRIAHARLRDGGRNTLLGTTALVNESYLRIHGAGELRAEDRRAFFADASQVMRSVIVNSAHERLAAKRGGGATHVRLTTDLVEGEVGDEAIVLKVHEALVELERADPRLAQVAQRRYFGGFEEQEIADALEVSVRTVRRDWQKARLMLLAAMR